MWVVLATIPPLAIGNIVATPAQYTALPRLLDEEELVRANGLLRATSESTAALSRGLAGAAIATMAVTSLYLADAVTFLVAAMTFRLVTVSSVGDDDAAGDAEEETEGSNGGEDDAFDLETYWRDFRKGMALLRDSVAGRLLAPSLLANFLFGVALAVLPAFADSVGGATTYGLLLAGLTVGGVLGATLAGFVDHYPLWVLGVVGFAASGLLWTGSVLLGGTLLTATLFGASRGAFRTFGVSLEAAFQTAVPEELVGRVMSAASGATSLAMPLGTLTGGLAGVVFGARSVMLVGGLGALAAALTWALHPALRGFEPPTQVEPGQFGEAM